MEDYEKFFNSSLHFLSFRARSEKEVLDNLKKKEAPIEIIEKIIQKLKELKFLDDKEFAKAWIEQRSAFKPRSSKVLKIELRQKGISEDIIEEFIEVKNDLALAKKLFEKNKRKFKGEDWFNKAAGFLQRKGFDWDIIKEVLKTN